MEGLIVDISIPITLNVSMPFFSSILLCIFDSSKVIHPQSSKFYLRHSIEQFGPFQSLNLLALSQLYNPTPALEWSFLGV